MFGCWIYGSWKKGFKVFWNPGMYSEVPDYNAMDNLCGRLNALAALGFNVVVSQDDTQVVWF